MVTMEPVLYCNNCERSAYATHNGLCGDCYDFAEGPITNLAHSISNFARRCEVRGLVATIDRAADAMIHAVVANSRGDAPAAELQSRFADADQEFDSALSRLATLALERR